MNLVMAFAFFQGAQGPSTFIWNAFPFILFFVVLYFFLLRPQIKQQKEHRHMVENMKKGDKVVTNGGIWGEIDSVEPQFVRLKISEKTKIVVTRSSITGPQPKVGKEESK